jgi:hypothetical protein
LIQLIRGKSTTASELNTAAFLLHGQRKGDEVILRAVYTDGQLAVDATALLASRPQV